MNSADLRQACPELDDLRRAVVDDWAKEMTVNDFVPTRLKEKCRALLAKLEAEKASAETAGRAKPNVIIDDPSPCYQPGGCKYRAASTKPEPPTCLNCGSPETCKRHGPCDTKPEPPKRSAEEILEAAIKDHEYNYDLDVPAIKEALRLVRELRQKYNALEESHSKAVWANEGLQAERDEANRRIEAAKEALDMHGLAPKSSAGVALRILSGGER